MGHPEPGPGGAHHDLGAVTDPRWSVSSWQLFLAEHVETAECLESPVAEVVGPVKTVVLYLAYGGLYVEDLNDEPHLESEYARGVRMWSRLVPALYDALCLQSGGGPLQFVHETQSQRWVGLPRCSDRRGAWAVCRIRPSPPLVTELTVYPQEPRVWTVDSERVAAREPQLSGTEVRRHLARAPWWFVHGYKEPFLVGRPPARNDLDAAVAEALVAAGAPLLFLRAQDFRPHRGRVHAVWAAAPGLRRGRRDPRAKGDDVNGS